MSNYELVILNAALVTDTETKECDLAIKDGKIISHEPKGSLASSNAKRSIDAEGGYVMVHHPLDHNMSD